MYCPLYDNSAQGYGYADLQADCAGAGRAAAVERSPGAADRSTSMLHDSQKQLLQNAYFEMLQDNAKVRNYFAEQILKQGASGQ